MPKATFLRSLFTATCLLLAATLAHAQWGWKEKDGRTVFSDQPPPQSVAEKDIIRRPPGSRAAVPSPAPAAGTDKEPTTAEAAAKEAAAAPKLPTKDPELEKRKNEAKAKEAAAKKAEEEKNAGIKRDNCERAKRAKASFDSGTRISTTNAQGEREVMGDAQRASESQRLQGIIATSCS